MTESIRLGVSGCGAVFARLYLPALARLPGFRLVAVADPDPSRSALAPAGCQAFVSFEAMLGGATLDAVALLGPPAVHGLQAGEALLRGLPVLVEKPAALRLAEVDAWPSAAAHLLTPAFPRRWWAPYRRLQGQAPGARQITIGIRTHLDAWGAAGHEDAVVDLLPHTADLVRWLSGRELSLVRVERGPRGARVTLALAGRGEAVCLLSHAGPYREAARLDGRTSHVGPPGAACSLLRRLRGQPEGDVAAIRSMLAAWGERVRGATYPDLPAVADARANVAILEQALAAPA